MVKANNDSNNRIKKSFLSYPIKKLGKYTCMLVFCVAFFSLVAVSIAWSADIISFPPCNVINMNSDKVEPVFLK
jgi:hypothetical protein